MDWGFQSPTTTYIDPNCTTTANSIEPNNNANLENYNSLLESLSVNPNSMENARLQFDYNISQIFTSNMTVNEQKRETNANNPTTSNDKHNDSQPRSIQSDFESIPCIENKDCEYLKLVIGFKRTLVLPDVFFTYDIPVCYCVLCLTGSGKNSLEGENWRLLKKFKILSLLFIHLI